VGRYYLFIYLLFTFLYLQIELFFNSFFWAAQIFV